MDTVRKVLNRDERSRAETEESVKVDKLIPLECYPQDLLIIDTNEINLPEFKRDRENHILNLTRDCIQHLVNTISNYPKETKDGKVFIKLAGPAYNLPREKPVPVPKPLTKWQQFAKEKGIRKTKKAKSTWDDVLQRWIPTYGYKKTAAEKEKNWLLEVPSNVDPNTDMFAEKAKIKKEGVAKNEYQRLRNIASARKMKVPRVAVPPMESSLHVPQLQLAAGVARVSTASLGQFQPKLPQEKNLPSKKVNRKRKRFMNAEEEKKTNINMTEKILKKKPKIDLSKAVNKQIAEEESLRRAEKSERKSGKKRKRSGEDGSKKRKNSFKKPKSSKGKRMGGKQKGGGRKRR